MTLSTSGLTPQAHTIKELEDQGMSVDLFCTKVNY